MLRIPRVEFDLSALLLGVVTSVAYSFFWPAMASLLGVAAAQTADTPAGPARDLAPGAVLHAGFTGHLRGWLSVPGSEQVISLLGRSAAIVRPSAKDPKVLEVIPPDVAFWKYGVAAVALLALWSILGGALARVVALRKARDESIPFDEALAYSFGNLRQFVQAPVFAAAAAALFVAVLLACGALSAIPWVGPVLQLVAQPVSLVAGLVTVILVAGLVLGFPMMTAAIAVERGGSLDAVSRAMVYIWTRPVPFALLSMIVLAVAGAAEVFGGAVLATGQNSFLFGVGLVDPPMKAHLFAAFQSAVSLGTPVVDPSLAFPQAASVWIGWAFFALAIVIARGFVVSYLVGGIVDVYFMLREDADQVPAESVYVESAPQSLGEPVAGQPEQR